MAKTTVFCVFTLTVILLAGCNGGSTASSAPKAAFSATLSYLDGKVLVNGVEATLGQSLPAQITVQTDGDSSCEITFNDRNIIRVVPGTTASLDLQNAVGQLKVQRGGVAAVLKKLDQLASGDRFQIQTGQTSAGVRGTTFFVHCDADSTYFCDCNGTVRTNAANSDKDTVLVAAQHKAVIFKQGSSGVTEEPAGLLYHTNADVETLAKKIGYEINWTAAD